MRFFGLFSRSPKPRVQSSSLCAPAKIKDHHSVVFYFRMGIRKGERVFRQKNAWAALCGRQSHFVPLPKKILENPVFMRFPRIFNFCEQSRLCLQNHRFSLIFPNFPKRKGVNLVSESHNLEKSGKVMKSYYVSCFFINPHRKSQR